MQLTKQHLLMGHYKYMKIAPIWSKTIGSLSYEKMRKSHSVPISQYHRNVFCSVQASREMTFPSHGMIMNKSFNQTSLQWNQKNTGGLSIRKGRVPSSSSSSSSSVWRYTVGNCWSGNIQVRSKSKYEKVITDTSRLPHFMEGNKRLNTGNFEQSIQLFSKCINFCHKKHVYVELEVLVRLSRGMAYYGFEISKEKQKRKFDQDENDDIDDTTDLDVDDTTDLDVDDTTDLDVDDEIHIEEQKKESDPISELHQFLSEKKNEDENVSPEKRKQIMEENKKERKKTSYEKAFEDLNFAVTKGMQYLNEDIKSELKDGDYGYIPLPFNHETIFHAMEMRASTLMKLKKPKYALNDYNYLISLYENKTYNDFDPTLKDYFERNIGKIYLKRSEAYEALATLQLRKEKEEEFIRMQEMKEQEIKRKIQYEQENLEEKQHENEDKKQEKCENEQKNVEQENIENVKEGMEKNNQLEGEEEKLKKEETKEIKNTSKHTVNLALNDLEKCMDKSVTPNLKKKFVTLILWKKFHLLKKFSRTTEAHQIADKLLKRTTSLEEKISILQLQCTMDMEEQMEESALESIEKIFALLCDKSVNQFLTQKQKQELIIHLLFLKAVAYGNLKRFNESIDTYSHILELDKQTTLHGFHHRSLIGRALSYEKNREYQKAINDYTVVLDKIFPRDTTALTNRGLCHQKMGQTREAIEDFTKAHNIDKTLVVPLLHRSVCYWVIGEREKAEQDKQTLMQMEHEELDVAMESEYERVAAESKQREEIQIVIGKILKEIAEIENVPVEELSQETVAKYFKELQ